MMTYVSAPRSKLNVLNLSPLWKSERGCVIVLGPGTVYLSDESLSCKRFIVKNLTHNLLIDTVA